MGAVPKRKDPHVRPTDGVQVADIRSARPDRHYVLVNKADSIQGVEYYEEMGYQIHMPEHGEERIRGARSRSDGQGIQERRGHVLMWISASERKRIEMAGPDGNTGQALADRISRQILDERHAQADAFRGQGRHMRLEHEVSPAAFDGDL